MCGHVEMRVRMVVAMVLNRESLLEDSWAPGFDCPTDALSVSGDSPGATIMSIQDYCKLTAHQQDGALESVFEKEAMNTARDTEFCGLWSLLALTYVMGANIQSVYPDKGWPVSRFFCNQIFTHPQLSGPRTLTFMWSSAREMLDEHWTPNHFVPLIPISNSDSIGSLLSDSADMSGHVVDSHDIAFKKDNFSIGSVTRNMSLGTPKEDCYYLVEWGNTGKTYVAQVLTVDIDDGWVNVNFMEEKGGLLYHGKEDKSWEPICNVKREVTLTMSSQSTNRNQFYTYQ